MGARICAALAVAAIAVAGCATGGGAKSGVPSSLTPSQKESFRAVAAEVPNPCAEEDLADYATLGALLEAGKTCHEAWILASDMEFFLREGVDRMQVQGMVRTEARAMQSPISFVTEGRPRLGNASAPVQIVVFSDFQCPFCARAATTMHRLYEARPQDVSIVFKQMPLTSIHPYAGAAAIISVYAQSQGRFWETHDTLFASQKDMNADMLTKILEDLGTTPDDLFDPDKGKEYSVTVIEDLQEARVAGVEGTPTVFVNGVFVEGGAIYERILARVDAEARAPDPSDPAAREAARNRALENCPYPGLEETYALLTPAGRADLSIYTESVLCPCPGNSHSLHDCASDLSCSAAGPIVQKLITRILEDVPQAEILDELGAAIHAGRTKP